MAKLSKEKYLVLMVDDSEDDCLLIRLAAGMDQRLHFLGSMSDGAEAVAYLQGEGKYSDRVRFPLPDLLLLDLVMPRKDGFEVLEWLQTQPFEDMVVVVLSGSDEPGDVRRALELGADHYQSKPSSPQSRQELIQMLQEVLLRRGS